MRSSRGVVLPVVLATLMIMLVLVPAMVMFTQTEAVWSQKQAANTTAFHLAEAGTEKAYLYVTQSTSTWASLMLGNSVANYRFDRAFEDVAGGKYVISITSGPGAETVTIISVGRDARARETRAIKVIYSNSLYGATAIYAGRGVQIGGQVNVEWGAVMSPYTVDAAGRAHPQFWSASQITGFDTSPDPPNCDGPNCCQWHAYQANLPPNPVIDFDFYRSSAQANNTGGCPAGGDDCYYSGSVNNWDHTTTGTVFIEGDLTVKSPGMFHTGDIVVMGNINLPNGAWGRGSVTMTMPADAWKQYCNDWTFYRNTFDSAAPAAFPGLNSTSYTSPSACAPAGSCASSKIAVKGMLYVGGNFNNGGGGGGNSDIFGVLYAVGSATQTANSGVTFYFNGDAANAVQSTTVNLTRVSWQDELRGWPSGL